MLLVIDVGNTNIVMGVFQSDRLVASWRVRTEYNTTEDEFNVLAAGLFAQSGIRFNQIRKTIISSVVPPMVTILDGFSRKYLGHTPHWIDAKSYPGMPILYSNPNEVGPDRIVNGVAAYHRHRSSLIVIDFGTATTFDVIDDHGNYCGGVIAPGINLSLEALHQAAAKLPRVAITRPKRVIGKSTVPAMQAGIFWGYVGLIEGLVVRIRKEYAGEHGDGANMQVIATGGLAPLFADSSSVIKVSDVTLTLDGLQSIYRRNRPR